STPCPADSAGAGAANGVDLREPLNPAPPEVAHDSALPCRSVIVMIVLLNDAWMGGTPSETFFLTFLRARVTVVLVGACAIRGVLGPDLSVLLAAAGRGLRRGAAAHRGRLTGLTRTLAGTGVGARALAPHRQALAMADAAIAAEIHQ